MLELDDDVGKIMDAIRAEVLDTIVIITADDSAWQDAWPPTPARCRCAVKRACRSRAVFRVPSIMSRPAHSGRRALRRNDVATWTCGPRPPRSRALPRRLMAVRRTTPASRSTSTALITPPMSRHGESFGTQVVDLYRRSVLPGRSRRHRRRTRRRYPHGLEDAFYRQGHLARPHPIALSFSKKTIYQPRRRRTMDLGASVRKLTLGALAASSFLVGVGAAPAKRANHTET